MAAIAVTSANTNRLGSGGRSVIRTSAGVPYIVLEDTTDDGIEVHRGIPTGCMGGITETQIGPDEDYGHAQSFIGTGESIKGVYFFLFKLNTPTDNIYAKIYAHTGTYGSSSEPTGTALATSDAVSASTLQTTAGWVYFSFATPYVTTNGTYYVISFEGHITGASNYIYAIRTSTDICSGNFSTLLSPGNWQPFSLDLKFAIIGEGGGTVNLFIEVDDANNPQSSGRYGNPSCAIDSSNIIHIIYADDNGTAPLYRYVTFNTATDTFSGDEAITSDLGADMTSSANMVCGIAIDSNNIPHVAYAGLVANMGTDYYTVYYNNRIGGAWNTSPGYEIYGKTAQNYGRFPDISIDLDNKPFISFEKADTSYSNRYTGAAIGNTNDASSFTVNITLSAGNSAFNTSCAVDSEGNHYIFLAGGSAFNSLNKHNVADAWTTWQTAKTNISDSYEMGSLVLNSSDIYLFYISGNYDIGYNKWSGTWADGSWAGATNIDVGTYNSVKSRSGGWFTDYVVANQTNYSSAQYLIRAADNYDYGQSVIGNGGKLSSVTFRFEKSGSPTGNLVSKVYAHSGTYGSSSIPTGSALATSDTITVASLSTGNKIFSFSGANQITLTHGTYYVITIEATDTADNGGYLRAYVADTGTYSGNRSDKDRTGSTWYPYSWDLFIKVLTTTKEALDYAFCDETASPDVWFNFLSLATPRARRGVYITHC